MADISIDNGYLLYIPDTDEPAPTPYWKTFMAVGKLAEHIGYENDDPGSDQFYLLDEDENLLAVQMLEPIDENGAPVERAINFAKELLHEEIVHEIITDWKQMKTTLGMTNEITTQEFIDIISSGMSDEEMTSAFEGVDNVFWVGDQNTDES